MKERINYFQVSPEAMSIMVAMEKYITSCYKTKKTLDYTLIELIKTRVAQINGCAYCIDMHTKDARKNGETEQRLYALSTWQEAPFYSAKERAALAWAEANTLISSHEITDELYENTRQHFNEEELVDLVVVINAINAWTRIALCFKPVVGSYSPGDFDV